MWTSWAKALGSIICAIAFVVGWLLNFSQNPILSPQVMMGVGFLLFVGFVAWTIRDLLYKIGQLEDKRADLEVNATVYNRRAILEVHNSGSTAICRAKARVIQGSTEAELYTMYWESESGQCRIDADATESILVAEPPQGYVEFGVRLFKMGASGEQVFLVSSETEKVEHNVAPAYDPTRVVAELRTYAAEYACVIEVTVSSDQGLKKPSKPRRFRVALNADGIAGMRFYPLETNS